MLAVDRLTWQAEVAYTLSVTATPNQGASGAVTATTSFVAASSAVQAVIAGGSARTVSVRDAVTLDGSSSFDPDVALLSDNLRGTIWVTAVCACVELIPFVVFASQPPTHTSGRVMSVTTCLLSRT